VDKRPGNATLTALTVLSALMLIAASYMALIYAPTERTMGAVQRIFYFHVGAAWAGALGFLVTVVAGVLYLATGQRRWDIVGLSSVEVGLALVSITLLSGPIWARYAWGVSWTWDPKLTSAAVMWLAYAAYLMLRRSVDDPDRRARFGAVYGIVAFAGVVMTYAGVRLAGRTIHPAVIGPSASTAAGEFGLAPRMQYTMIFCFLTFALVYFTLLLHRIRLERLAERVDQLKAGLLAG
jgi:heme exporter protein C